MRHRLGLRQLGRERVEVVAGEVEVRHRVELAELPRALLEAAPAEIDLEDDDDDDDEEVGRERVVS